MLQFFVFASVASYVVLFRHYCSTFFLSLGRAVHRDLAFPGYLDISLPIGFTENYGAAMKSTTPLFFFVFVFLV